MKSYTTKFIRKKPPMNEEEAKHLSAEITLSFGSEGWEVVSTATVANPGGSTALLLTLQKEEAG